MSISSSATGLRAGVCTSTTRPANPYTGQIIYETDTGQMQVWNGVSWGSLNPTANRNVLINGGMDVWQRGTAVQFNQGQGAYGPDRWCGAHQFQNSRTQRTAITSPPSGLWTQYACRVSNPSSTESAGGSRMRLVQKIESVNSIPLRGRRVTLSFWVRFSAASFTVTSGNYQDFIYTIGAYTSTTDSATNTTAADVSADGYITAGAFPTTWTRYTLSYDVPTNTNNVEVRFGLVGLGIHTSSDVNWYEVTQVQLEVGTQTSAFEQRSYGSELALCQRYYCKTFNNAVAPASAAGQAGSLLCTRAASTGATAYVAMFVFPSEMRTAPSTVTTFNTNTTGSTFFDEAGGTVTAATANAGTRHVSIYNTGTATVGRNAVIHATADAEL